MFAKFLENYPERRIAKSASTEDIAKYSGLVPSAMLEFWTKFGFGSYLNDYLKVVFPGDFDDLLARVYVPKTGQPTTLFATGMSDLLVWENGYLTLINFRVGVSTVIESGFQFFFDDLCDPDFLDTNMRWQPYPEARQRLGPLPFDECYGYVPILAAGGTDNPTNLKRLKLREHLLVIESLAGPV